MALILIIEDDEFIREAAEICVGDLGHAVEGAGDVAPALEILAAGRQFDLIFTDIRLHRDDRGGIDIAAHAVRACPGVAVIYTSGASLTPEIAGELVAGSVFLQKPYTHDQLCQAIEALLAGKMRDPVPKRG